MKIKHGLASVVCISLASCGGGGGTESPTAPSPAPVSTRGTAALVMPAADTKFQWEIAMPIAVSLLDSNNAVVAGPLACTAAIAGAVDVSANCTSLTAKRIGAQMIVVTSGSTTASFVIKAIPQRQPLTARSIASGATTYSATTAGGIPWFWGVNSSGKLAQLLSSATLNEAGLPMAAKEGATTPMVNIVSSTTGTNNAMALTEDGEIWSWGGASLKVLGFVSPTPDVALAPGKVRNAANSENLTHIVQIGLGQENASALADDGSVYSWGNGVTAGQGTNASGAFANKVQLANGTFLSDIVQISVGNNFTLALTRSGAVYAWGSDNTLNTSTAVSAMGKQVAYATPVVAAGTLAPLSGIVSVSAGHRNSMALTASGTVYVWGGNDFGQLGQGNRSAAGIGSLAVLVKAPATQSGNLNGIKAISAGGNHLLALTATGEVLAWGITTATGEGNTVNLGNEVTLPRYVIDISGTGNLIGIKAIAAGYDNSLALMPSGEVLMWGRNFASSLGQNLSSVQLATSRVPLKVKDATGTGTINVGPIADFRNLLQQFP